MPYLTPDNAPDDYAPFVLYLPVNASGQIDTQLGSLIYGALLELTYPENYEAYGALTPDDVASIFRAVYDLSVPFSEA